MWDPGFGMTKMSESGSGIWVKHTGSATLIVDYLVSVHVGDVLHLWLHELVAARHVGELEHVERHTAHARLRQRVQPRHIRAPVVDLKYDSFVSNVKRHTAHAQLRQRVQT
jgi:hypothetical protein